MTDTGMGDELRKVIAEMQAVATDDDRSVHAEWTAENRATIDAWQVRLQALPVPVAGETDLIVPESDLVRLMKDHFSPSQLKHFMVSVGLNDEKPKTAFRNFADGILALYALPTLATERVSDQVQATSVASATECDHLTTEKAADRLGDEYCGELRAALEPFARAAAYITPQCPDNYELIPLWELTAKHFRAARSASQVIANQENLLRSEPETSSPALPEKAVEEILALAERIEDCKPTNLTNRISNRTIFLYDADREAIVAALRSLADLSLVARNALTDDLGGK